MFFSESISLQEFFVLFIYQISESLCRAGQVQGHATACREGGFERGAFYLALHRRQRRQSCRAFATSTQRAGYRTMYTKRLRRARGREREREGVSGSGTARATELERSESETDDGLSHSQRKFQTFRSPSNNLFMPLIFSLTDIVALPLTKIIVSENDEEKNENTDLR